MTGWQEAGDPSGFPVLVHHGTPGPRELDPAAHQAATARGLRLLMPDRPGYGDRPDRPHRTVADTAALVDEAQQRFGLGRLACLGYSGGGSAALAGAALRPDSVVGVAVLAGMAPYPGGGWDWFDGMDSGGVAELTDAIERPAALVDRVRGSAAWMRSTTPAEFLGALQAVTTARDREALEGEFGAFFFGAMARAADRAVPGWVADNRASVVPWGFDPAQIRVPVAVIHGEEDPIVPPGHGRFLARTIALAQWTLLPGVGHFAVWSEGLPRALDAIASFRSR